MASEKPYRPDYYAHCGPGRRPKFAAFDLETDGLGGRVLAASYMTEDMHADGLSPGYIATGDIIQKLFEIMTENNQYDWFAHNAQYEFRYFISRLEDLKERVTFYSRTDSDVFMVQVELPEYGTKSKLVIRDSMALWPGTLRQFGDQFCPELPKLEIDFDQVTFDPSNENHIEYSKRDSIVLLLSLMRFNALIFENFHVNIRATIASTALAGWQRTLEAPSGRGEDREAGERYYNDKAHEDFVRTSYYGGLVFLTDTKKYDDATSYDVNSSYPYQMLTHSMPLGAPVKTKLYSARHLGIYRVKVSCPLDVIVPIIPKRDAKGIVWPSGVFETTVTSEELKFAVSMGYRVLQILDGRVWQNTCKPFEAFISVCRTLRFQYPGTALETVAKLMQNSLYGKFGAKRTRRKIYGWLPQDETIGCEQWGEFLIREEHADDMQCLPQWAVFITAYARLHLLRAIYAIGPANVLYGDTDSITVKAGIVLEESKDYGGWKRDKKWKDFRVRGPKVYAGHLAKTDKETGAEVIVLTGAAKGIPRRHWQSSGVFKTILENKPSSSNVIAYKQLEKFVSALKTGYIGQHEASRSISTLGNSRSWKQFGDGSVRPRTWAEIEAASGSDHHGERGSISPIVRRKDSAA